MLRPHRQGPGGNIKVMSKFLRMFKHHMFTIVSRVGGSDQTATNDICLDVQKPARLKIVAVLPVIQTTMFITFFLLSQRVPHTLPLWY